MATLLRTDGTQQAITEPLTLKSMQRLVGGYIEFVRIGGTPQRSEFLIVDEEGLLKKKSINEVATALYRGDPPRHSGLIVGDAIRCMVTSVGLEDEAYE
jgi:hypothetical protein